MIELACVMIAALLGGICAAMIGIHGTLIDMLRVMEAASKREASGREGSKL